MRFPAGNIQTKHLAFSGNNNPFPAVQDRQQHNEWIDEHTIFIANRDGTGFQQVVDEAGPFAWSPELSPDGEKILYTQAIKGPHQIFKIDVHSGIQTPLTDKIWSFGGDWFDPMHALSVSPQPNLLTTTWGTVKKRE